MRAIRVVIANALYVVFFVGVGFILGVALDILLKGG